MTQLGDVTEMLVGFAFKSAGFLDADSDGVRLLRGDNVQQGYIRWGDKTKKWPAAQSDDLGRYQLAEDDVILAMDRPIVGDGLKMAWIRQEDLPALLVQRVCRLRGKPGVALTNFIRYVLAAPNFSGHIHRITTGANIPHISGKDIAAYEFELPDLDDQARIVECLAAYDDLIATNQRRIALLEDAARRLYREWFVHLRFPGHEWVPVRDGVPEGWLQGSAHDFISILSGGTPKTGIEHYWGGDIPFFTPKDSPDAFYVLGTEKTLTESGLASCNSRFFAKNTTFITARGTVGKVALAQKPMAMNQSCYALVPKQDYDNLFLFAAIKDAVEHFKQVAVGGVFDAIVVDTFKVIPFVLPDAAVTRAFGNAVRPLFQQVETLLLENTQLAQARDLLLPKLMSGQLNVSCISLPEEVTA
jgi:type I restriction enzyme S subunit